MSLQLTLGNSGSGKTTLIFDKIIKESIDNPHKNYIIIVPEQYTMETQKKLVSMHPRGGILNIDVLSFGRLCHRIFSEVGQPPEIILDDEGKNLILRKIAKNNEKDLKIFGKNLKKFGYISEIKSVISEFSQYNICDKDLSEFATYLSNDTMFENKLREIGILYQEFEKYLDGKYLTNEGMIEKLIRKVHKSEILKNSIVVFDGFTGFTPVQYKLIENLLPITEKMHVTVTIDNENVNKNYDSDLEIFAISKHTIHNLKKIALKKGIEVCDPRILCNNPTIRYIDNPELAFLEENIFRYKNSEYTDEVNNIILEVKNNGKDEVQWVAQTIRKMVRTESYRYRDFAVICSDSNIYNEHLERAFNAFDIPVFSDNKRSLLMNSFVEHIRSLLEMIDKNYTYESTFRFLKSGIKLKIDLSQDEFIWSGYGIFSNEAVDVLENYVLKSGIQGFKNWQKPWGVKCNTRDEKQFEFLNEKRVQFVEYMDIIHKNLKQRSKSVEDISAAIYEFMNGNRIQEKIEDRARYFESINKMELEKEYSQIYQVFIDLLDKFVNILGDEKVSLKEYIELLDAGLIEAKIGVIPPTLDTVVVGDLQRTRLGNIKILFLVGANDTLLPGKLTSGGLLSEMEREQFKNAGLALKPGVKEQMYLHKFYMYLNLTKATEKLYISYPLVGSDQKVTRPSYLVSELIKNFPKLKINNTPMGIEDSELTARTALQFIVEAYKDSKLRGNKSWMELYQWYRNNKDYAELMDQLLDEHLYREVEDTLSGEVANELYGEILRNSVSKLEKYASCPFSHFIDNGLKLRERDVFEYNAADIGNVLHNALELYAKEIEANNSKWGDITVENQGEISERLIDECISGYKEQVFEENSRNEYMISRMKRLMKRSVWALSKQLESGQFIPKGFELQFGFDQNKDSNIGRIALDNGKEMQLRGTIDRVDEFKTNESVLVKIVDYKTGKKKLSLSSLYEGLQLQLFVYLDAAVKLTSEKYNLEASPAGVFYYRVEDPVIESKPSESYENLQGKILGDLKLDGLVSEDNWGLFDLIESGQSKVAPIYVKKDGTMSSNVPYAKEGELEMLMEVANKKVKEFGNNIVSGDIKIQPYKEGDDTGCQFCKYSNICGFEPEIGKYKYKQISSATNKEILEELRAKENEDE